MIYQPEEDSYLLKKIVRTESKGKRVLDVGCGSGIQAEAAKKAGAKSVIAVDINKEIVKYCKKKGINCIESDLFEKVNSKFDLIVFNPPYLPLDEREDLESSRVTSGGKKGDEIIARFLGEVGDYLDDGGKILMVVSSLTFLDRINEVMGRRVLLRRLLLVRGFLWRGWRFGRFKSPFKIGDFWMIKVRIL